MTLKDQLLENTNAFSASVHTLPEANFNTKPHPDTWSVADVLEHIYRSEFGIPRLFTSETRPVSDREPDAKLDYMKERLIESDKKVRASGVILPTEGDKIRSQLLDKFKQNRIKIAELIEKLPENEVCLNFEHPIFGFLTHLEWVRFIMLHAQRHSGQIERIKSQL